MKANERASLPIKVAIISSAFALLPSCSYVEPLLPLPPTEPVAPVAPAKDEPGRLLTTVELADVSWNVYGNVPYFKDTGKIWRPFAVDTVACNKTDRAEICRALVDNDIGFSWRTDDVVSNGGDRSTLSLEYIHTVDSGLQAALYRQANSNAFVLAFAGTKKANDIPAGLGLTVGASPSPRIFQKIARDVTARMDTLTAGSRHPRKLQITGHSLGGYHAQLMSTVLASDALVTFNSPGSGATRAKWSVGNTRAKKALHYVRRQDKVHLAGGSHFAPATYFFEAQHHNLHGLGQFREHLRTNPLTVGSDVHTNKVLMSFETTKSLIGRIPGISRLVKGQAKVCARGSADPRDLQLKAGSCIAATTFNYTSTGFILNFRTLAGETKPRCFQENGNSRPVTMEVCNGSRRQAWKPNGPRLRNVRTGRCLDMSKGGNNAGQLITYTCHDGLNQKWRFD